MAMGVQKRRVPLTPTEGRSEVFTFGGKLLGAEAFIGGHDYNYGEKDHDVQVVYAGAEIDLSGGGNEVTVVVKAWMHDASGNRAPGHSVEVVVIAWW